MFDKSGDKILAVGTATGSMFQIDEDRVVVSDMTVAMPVDEVKKLKNLVEGELHRW